MTGEVFRPHSKRAWVPRLALGLMLACITLLFAATPRASALEIGLMSGENAWLEPEQWDVMDHSGVTVYRLMVRDNTGWAANYDAAFTYAAERGITILPYFYGFQGSERFPTNAVYEKTGSGSWQEWVEYFVRRYGYSGTFWPAHPSLPYKPVTAWEIWNEPNRAANNPGGTIVQPQAYAEFLRYTSYLVKAAQYAQSGSGTQVVFGGLYSPLKTEKNGKGEYVKMSVADFLKVAHIAGLGEHFDSLSVHPYGFTTGDKLAQFKAYVEEARTALNLYSSAKTLSLSEVGWPVGAPGEIYVSEVDQAELLTKSFNWVQSEWWNKNISNVIWYTYRDTSVLESWADSAGLRPKSKGAAFRASWYRLQEQTGAPKWPVVEWHMDNLGGKIASDPDISSWGYGRLDVFAKGPENELLHRAYNGGWQAWENFGGNLASAPSAVSWGPNRVDVVARSTTNNLLHWAWNGSEWVADTIEANITSAPDISSRGYGILDIFARGPKNELVHRWFNGFWGPWENLGGTLEGGPGAVSWNSHRMDVVGRAPNGTVPHWAWNEVSWPFDNLGGNITSDPDISSRGYGSLDVFAKGGGNELVHLGFNGTWGVWEALPGGTIASGPGAVSWNSERIDVVARATDDSVAHWSYGLVLPN